MLTQGILVSLAMPCVMSFHWTTPLRGASRSVRMQRTVSPQSFGWSMTRIGEFVRIQGVRPGSPADAWYAAPLFLDFFFGLGSHGDGLLF